MKFIDVHTHPCFNISSLRETANRNGINFSAEGFLTEMDSVGIEYAVAIGVDTESNNLIRDISKKIDRIIPVLGVNLEKKSNFSTYFEFAKKALSKKEFRGIKIYLGYDHVAANSKFLEPLYRLAEKYNIPVIFHTGDTFKPMRKSQFLKYCHPLIIDEVAVTHPGIKFVIAHSGNPWTEDAAEVVYKNDNCYADISGWFLQTIDQKSMKFMREKLEKMVAFAGNEKIMFGSDWPLLKMKPYTNFIMSSLRMDDLQKIAYKNAKKFWSI